MTVFAVTGSASGIGYATATKLRAAGHRVIGIDRTEADVIADLSTSAGRDLAAQTVLKLSKGRLDGAVMAAGLGPTTAQERKITTVNVLGVTDLLTAWQPALRDCGSAKVVVFGSNS